LQLQGAANLATATTGNSAKVKVGQAARAVGNANGGGKLVVTSGKVLALNRSITVQEDDGESALLAHLVETSARLVPGDSGGPLPGASGRVIGMDAAGSTSSLVGSPAPGYAIAINHALTVAKQIAAMQASTLVHIGPTAFIGLNVQNGTGGIAVGGIVAGSPAESAGLAAGGSRPPIRWPAPPTGTGPSQRPPHAPSGRFRHDRLHGHDGGRRHGDDHARRGPTAVIHGGHRSFG